MSKKEISPADLGERLAPGLCATRQFVAGDELRRKDQHYTDMYLIVDGQVDVRLSPGADPIRVGPGFPVGEIGFLKGCRATATAVAREPTTALVLDDDTLWRIEREDPMLAVFLLRALAATAESRISLNADLEAGQGAGSESNLEILLCRTDELLEDAMRLRYRVYCVELGRSSPYADHERKMIRDNLDDFGHTFIAVDEGTTIGTLRVNLATQGPLGHLEEIYGMTASSSHPDHTAICTMFIVEKTNRDRPAALDLIGAMASYVSKAGARECFIDSIPAQIPFYERIGFVPSGERFFHYQNGPSVPMVMDLARYTEST